MLINNFIFFRFVKIDNPLLKWPGIESVSGDLYVSSLEAAIKKELEENMKKLNSEENEKRTKCQSENVTSKKEEKVKTQIVYVEHVCSEFVIPIPYKAPIPPFPFFYITKYFEIWNMNMFSWPQIPPPTPSS